MTVTVINIGNLPNDGTGDNIRDAFDNVNTSILTLDSQTYFNQKLFTSNLVNGQVFYIESIVANNTITAENLIANTVSFDGILTVSNTTSSISPTTGALTVAGGAGILGTSHFGGDIYVNGTIHGTIAAGSSSFTNIDDTPIGITIPGDARFLTVEAEEAVTINDATPTTSFTTGALTVVGGISSRANIYASNTVLGTTVKATYLSVSNRVIGSLYLTGSDNIFINGSPVATSVAAFAGGIVPGQTRFTSAVPSLGPGSGAVIVTGGVGIGGNLNVTGQINAGGQFVDSQGVRVADIGLFPNNTVAGTLITSAQPNITTTGALLGLTLGGNLEAGLSNQYQIGSDLSPFLRVYAFQVTASQIDGVLQTSSQPLVTSLGTLTGLTTSGNIYAANLIVPSIYAQTIGNTATTLNANLISTAYGSIGNVVLGNVTVLNSNVGNSVTTTGVVTNFSSPNVWISGGNVKFDKGEINVGEINNFSSPNVYIFGGYISGVANVRATEGQFTNLSSGNVVLSGGYVQGLANVRATEGQFTNLSSGNVVLSGGYISGVANVRATEGQFTNLSSGNVYISGGYAQSLANVRATEGQFTNLSSGNVILSGGASVGGPIITSSNIVVTSTDDVADGPGYAIGGAVIVAGGVGITKNMIVYGNVTIKGAITTAPSVTSTYNGPSIFNAGIVTANVKSADIGNIGTVLTGTLSSSSAAQTNITSLGTLTGLTASGNIVAGAGTTATDTTSGALVVAGGVGISGAIITGGNIVITSTTEVADVAGSPAAGALIVAGGAGIGKSMIVYGDLTVKGAIQATQSVSSTYSGLSIFSAGIIAANVRSGDIGNVGTILTGTLTTDLQPNITKIGVQTGLTSSGNILANSGTASTNTTSGALVVAGGVGISGNLNIGNTGDVSANIGTLFRGNATINANIGAYQTFANANVASLQNQITGANTNIQTTSANLGAYQTWSNANSVSQQNQITGANTNIQTTSANIGAYQTFANANVSSLQNQITGANTNIQTTSANLGAYQTFANANVSSLQNQITGANTNIQTTSANLGAYQTWSNANSVSQQNQITGANTNIQTTSANLGAYQTYANTKIGTNNNGNLVVTSANVSTNTTTGALVVAGGVGIGGNLNIANTGDVSANIGNLVNTIGGSGGTSIQANLGAYQTYANTKIGTNNNGNLVVTSANASISTSTGALVVKGGVGVAGNVTAGGTLTGANVKVGTLTYLDTAVLGVFQSSINNYNQFILQNSNAGDTASSDFIVSNDIAAAGSHYGDFGINSSQYVGSGSFGKANAVYMYASDGDLVLGTYTSNAIRFVINADSLDAALIDTNGNLVITSTQAAGNVNTGALVVKGGVGVGGILWLQNTGDVSANIGSYQLYANSNVATIQANLGTLFRGNASINANLGAYQTFANANIAAIQANLGSTQIWANANIASINANLGAYQTFANANIAAIQANLGTVKIDIANIVTNSNANTLAYLAKNTISVLNFSTGNAVITGGYAQSLANVRATEGQFTNLSSGNVIITGGYINNVANVVTSSNIVVGANLLVGYATISSAPVNSVVLSGYLGVGTSTPAYTVEAVGAAHVYGAQINTIAVPGPATGTLSGTGGSLPGSVVFSVQIVAIDEFGLQSLASNYSNQLTTAGATSSIAYTWTAVTAAASYRIYVYTGASPVLSGYFTSVTNSYTLQSVSGILTNNLPFGSAGNVLIRSNAASSSKTTGALVVLGGVGTGGAIYSGANINISTGGGLTTDQSVGYLFNEGAVTVKIGGGGATKLDNPTDSTSSSTGALQVAGGVAVGKKLWIKDAGDVSANLAALVNLVGSGSGFDIVANLGAVSSYANTKIGTNTNSNVVIESNAKSTSTVTGAIVTNGGIGIRYGNINIGGSGGNALVSTNAIYSGNVISNSGFFWGNGAPYSPSNQDLLSTSSPTFANISIDNVLISSAISANIYQGGYLKFLANFNARSTTPLSSKNTLGDFWYDTATDILFKYIYDGANYAWLDISSPYLIDPNTIVTGPSLSITGSGTLTGSLTVNSTNQTVAIANGGTNGSGSIGASGAAFGTIYAKATTAQYADLAENYVPDRLYEPGTVVVIGGDKEITETNRDHDARVAGVISTNPAYLMNSESPGQAVALMGRVPCMVIGPVGKGDLLVTSRLAGVAQKMDPARYQPGCIIGKSLENISISEIRTIEIMVGRL